jgi:hypothetical protein
MNANTLRSGVWCAPWLLLLATGLGGCRCAGAGDPCDSTNDCRNGLVCDPTTRTCREPNAGSDGAPGSDAVAATDAAAASDATPGTDAVVTTDAAGGPDASNLDAAGGTDATTCAPCTTAIDCGAGGICDPLTGCCTTLPGTDAAPPPGTDAGGSPGDPCTLGTFCADGTACCSGTCCGPGDMCCSGPMIDGCFGGTFC